MISRVYLLFEILAFLLCIYGLYGKKLQWNIYTVLCIGIEVAFYYTISTYRHFSFLEPIIYLLLFIYSLIQFRQKMKYSIVNFILCMVLCSSLQLICYLPVMIWPDALEKYPSFVVNTLLLIIMFLLYRLKILKRLSDFMQEKGKIVLAFLLVVIVFIIIAKFTFKTNTGISNLDYFILIGSILLLFVTIVLLLKERMINKQMMAEKELSRLYGTALTELIEKVKINQHNYKNQLVAIQGMVFTAESLEDLRAEQQKYYSSLQQEDQYSNLLSGNNDPMIAGFLYSKLCNVDRNILSVQCSLHVGKEDNALFLSDVIKVLGVLIDNAMEEVLLECYTNKAIRINLYEDEEIHIDVRNICRKITFEEMAEFFKKGNSTKGKDRGLGLYYAKEIARKWNGEVIPQNIEEEGDNWFSIQLSFSKRKRL